MLEQAHITPSRWQRFCNIVGIIATGIWRGVKYLLSWQWTKVVLHWLVTSAGVMSELVFLVASIWVSLNANVHQFILTIPGVTEATTQNLTGLSTTAYVALPECISFLAVITTLSHVRTWWVNKQDFKPLIWVVFFGLPTLVFVGLSVYTLGHAVTDFNFQMDNTWKVIRVLSAWEFAFCSFVYGAMGVKQEADRLKEKDVIISDLKLGLDSKVSELTEKLESETSRLNAIIAQQNAELQKSKRGFESLQNAVIKSNEDGLEAYSQDCKNWLKSGIKTANADEINEFTGHSKTKIANAIKAGKLLVSSRNKSLITISSLVEWLKDNQPQTGKIVALKQPHSEIDTDELEAVSM